MKSIITCFLFFCFSGIKSQSLIQLSPLIDVSTVNEAVMLLKEFNYKLHSTDEAFIGTELFDVYYFGKAGTESSSIGMIGLFMNRNRNSIYNQIDFGTNDFKWFNRLQTALENNSKTTFLFESNENGKYSKCFENDGLVYTCSVTKKDNVSSFRVTIFNPLDGINN